MIPWVAIEAAALPSPFPRRKCTAPDSVLQSRYTPTMSIEPCTHAENEPIQISEAERVQRSLSEENLRRAALLLHTRGYVILRNAVPDSLAQLAADKFREVFQDCVNSKKG